MEHTKHQKKIGFFINNLGFGGAERVFVDDINSLLKENHLVYLFVLYWGRDKSPLIDQISLPVDRVFFLNFSSIRDVFSYVKTYKCIRENDIDVLYSTLQDAIFVSRVVSIFIPRIKLVTREANTTDNKSFLHRLADKIMNVRVDTMVVVSREVGKSLLSYQGWYKSKIRVLYNGVDIPKESSLDNDGGVILTVGSLTPKKSQSVLIDAFSLIHLDCPNYTLNIIGSGVMEDSLKEMVKAKGLEKKVIFLGNLSYNDMGERYKNSSIFVLSSNQEGCPNALLEAMSYGLPSVATSVGAVPEIIEDEVSGFVVPRNNSELLAKRIKILVLSKDLRKKMGSAGIEKVKNNFSKEGHFLELKNILFQ